MSVHHISQIINEMINQVKKRNDNKYHKPHFLRILLNEQVNFKKTLNQTLRDNDEVIRIMWMDEMNITSKSLYYTILGETLINYLDDNLENDLLNLTSDEREKLIQEIIQKTTDSE